VACATALAQACRRDRPQLLRLQGRAAGTGPAL